MGAGRTRGGLSWARSAPPVPREVSGVRGGLEPLTLSGGNPPQGSLPNCILSALTLGLEIEAGERVSCLMESKNESRGQRVSKL